MPEYRFCGEVPYDYPAIRDTASVPLGTVEPGDVRDLDEPPGPWWVLNGDGGSGGTGGPAGAPPPPPAGPPAGIPVPTAAPPAGPAAQTDQAGQPGSEE